MFSLYSNFIAMGKKNAEKGEKKQASKETCVYNSSSERAIGG
jgi:hypothetical protein